MEWTIENISLVDLTESIMGLFLLNKPSSLETLSHIYSKNEKKLHVSMLSDKKEVLWAIKSKGNRLSLLHNFVMAALKLGFCSHSIEALAANSDFPMPESMLFISWKALLSFKNLSFCWKKKEMKNKWLVRLKWQNITWINERVIDKTIMGITELCRWTLA